MSSPALRARHLVLLALAACAARSPAPVAPAAPRPRLRVEPFAHTISWTDGRPFLYLADTCWELLHRTTLDEARVYLDDRAAKGFTVVQATLVSEIQGLTSPSSNGELPWRDRDPAKPNEAYFRYVDQVVDLAERRGLVMALLPAWGDRFDNPSDRTQEVFTPDNAEAYGAFLGARYAAHDVIWILGGGRNPRDDGDLAIVRALARGLERGHGGQHLMTYHPYRRGSSAEWFHDDPWLSFDMFQTGHEAPNMPAFLFAGAGYERNAAKPVLDGESNYEDHPYDWDPTRPRFSDVYVRKAAYWSLLSGAAGHAYGHDSVWQLWQPGREPWSYARTPWRQALDAPGARQMLFVRRLFESRPFERLRPDPRLFLDTNEAIYNYVSNLRAEDGSFAMLYDPTGRPLKVDLARLAPGPVRATWFDPRTGATTPAGTHAATGPHLFVPDVADVPELGDGHDLVLVLDREGERFPLPGAAPYVRAPAAPPSNGQRLLLDGFFRYETDGFVGDIHPTDPLPTWRGARDYARGRVFVRVEVMQKRNRTPMQVLGRVGSGPHHDRAQVIVLGAGKGVFDAVGVVHFELPMSEATPLVPEGRFRWDAPVTFLQVALADARGNRVSDWEQDLGAFSGQKRDYFPTRVRYTAILVPAGETFVPPRFW
jgi:hypothetical protein